MTEALRVAALLDNGIIQKEKQYHCLTSTASSSIQDDDESIDSSII
jgi:hypothetical protein